MPGGLLISYSNLSIREKYVLARIKIIRLLRILYEKYILNFSKNVFKKMKKISKDWYDFYEVAITTGEQRNYFKTILYRSSFNIKVYRTSKYVISTFTVLISNIFL